LGEATQNAKLMDGRGERAHADRRPEAVITKATKSIAQFKLRERDRRSAAMVTLRGRPHVRIFSTRLVNVALPRVRDFRGISTKSFDGRGNYTLEIRTS